ncbi:hypothetical protein [Nitrosopumilus sp.]|uniref:hypothetical protein n=1 Tax=Nitrosopumilus sp. TaxID=2024843 RepID=UPI00247C2CE6|nr:hypothetical protein [Nitrosopumilus sp.]MCV0409364.1 hypothetical protein [Nitrosopumilus sp.]
MDDSEICTKLIQIVKESSSNPKGITKTELGRIFIQRWGTSYNMIWDHILDLIDSGEIESRKISKQRYGLFLIQ